MKVLAMDPITDTGLDRSREASYEVEAAYNVEGDALLGAVSDASGFIVRSGTQVTAGVFEAAPDLIIVGCAGIGIGNIDVGTVTQHGAIAANVPERNVRAATEYTVAMGFAAAYSTPQAHAHLKDDE